MRMGTFLYVCAERGLEDSALILIAMWHREGPAMAQQFNVNHGHPDGDLLTSILAYEWFLENKRHYNHKYSDWKTAWTQEWKAYSKVGLPNFYIVFFYINQNLAKKRGPIKDNFSLFLQRKKGLTKKKRYAATPLFSKIAFN